jgi:hypothetical protein
MLITLIKRYIILLWCQDDKKTCSRLDKQPRPFFCNNNCSDGPLCLFSFFFFFFFFFFYKSLLVYKMCLILNENIDFYALHRPTFKYAGAQGTFH